MSEHYINRIIKSWEADKSQGDYDVLPDLAWYGDICLMVKPDEYGFLSVFARGAIQCMNEHECGYMLDSDPDELKLLVQLGDKRAFLMYPACKILNRI